MRRARERAHDGRVRKTQSRLKDALVSLIHEKSYDSIVVKEILARADVGRTAFYAHFFDKDALLASSIQDVLRKRPVRSDAGPTRPFSHLLWFSLPVFEHIERYSHSGRAHMDRHGRDAVHQHLHRVLVDEIASDIRAAVRPDTGAAAVPADLLVEYVVATFILVLNWWVDSGSTLSPQEVDAVFLALVGPMLAAE